MKELSITFLGFQINNVSYIVKDLPLNAIDGSSKVSEEITTSFNGIESKINKDFSEVFVKCDVQVKTNASDEKYDFRNLSFQYICRFKINGSAENANEIEELLNKGGMSVALTHIRDVIKGITSIDDRGPIHSLDRSFPDSDLKKRPIEG